MQQYRVTVAIPTLSAGQTLWECMKSLREQTFQGFQAVIIDNSGRRLVRKSWPEDLPAGWAEVLEPEANLGYGAACNRAAAAFPSEFLAVINDDAAADPHWLEELVSAMDRHPRAGSAASQVRLGESGDRIDSAGMLIAADGTSKQRGHRDAAAAFSREEPALLASGSAAIYRTEMLRQTGGFDESFFLYCEDTDLGLRSRWAGWDCVYAARAIVHHHYSTSAGKASELKAFYVERNRLYTVAKNFPFLPLLLTLPASALRYLHHLSAMRRGEGAAGAFRAGGGSGLRLPWIVCKAYCQALAALPTLLAKRRHIRRSAAIGAREFRDGLRRFRISLREVAAQ